MKHKIPCVIYLHGNSSSQLEAQNLIDRVLCSDMTLFAFDFAGSGISEGEFISLGYYEKDDLEAVIDFLRKSEKVSTIGLWGRSMGAVTALMHADRDPSIAGMCLDSPFYDLKQVCHEMVDKRVSIFSKSMIDSAIDSLRETIKEKAHFDIYELNPLQNNVDKSFVPAYFLSAKDDELFDCSHAKKLHDKYNGEKLLRTVEGTHNSMRPDEVINEIMQFFNRCLNPQGNNSYKSEIKYESSPDKHLLYSQMQYDEDSDPDFMHAIAQSLKEAQKNDTIYSSNFKQPK